MHNSTPPPGCDHFSYPLEGPTGWVLRAQGTWWFVPQPPPPPPHTRGARKPTVNLTGRRYPHSRALPSGHLPPTPTFQGVQFPSANLWPRWPLQRQPSQHPPRLPEIGVATDDLTSPARPSPPPRSYSPPPLLLPTQSLLLSGPSRTSGHPVGSEEGRVSPQGSGPIPPPPRSAPPQMTHG